MAKKIIPSVKNIFTKKADNSKNTPPPTSSATSNPFAPYVSNPFLPTSPAPSSGGGGSSGGTSPAPSSGGGGGSSGGGSSGGSGGIQQALAETGGGKLVVNPTSPATGNNLSAVKSAIEQQKLKEQIDKLNAQRQFLIKVGSSKNEGLQQTTISSGSKSKFPDDIKKIDQKISNLKSQQRSVPPITEEYIASLRGGGIPQKEIKEPSTKAGKVLQSIFKTPESIKQTEDKNKFTWKEFLTADPKITQDEANLAMKYLKDRELSEKVLRDTKNFQSQSLLMAESELNSITSSAEYIAYVNSLQERANRGEDIDKINKELESYNDKIVNTINSKLNMNQQNWFKDYKENIASQYEKDAVKDLIAFNARYGTPKFKEIKKQYINSLKSGLKTGAIVTGGLGIASSIKPLASTAKGVAKVGGKIFSAPVQIAALSGLAMKDIVDRERRKDQLIREYGFTSKEAFDISRYESQARVAKFGTSYLGFTTGAIASSAVIGSGFSSIKSANLNRQISNFEREFAKNPAIQNKYLTKSNIKKGYFTRNIEGTKVKFNIDPSSVQRASKVKEGIIPISQTTSVGVQERTKIKTILDGLNINMPSGYEVTKINQKIYSRISKSLLKDENAYLILSGVGKERTGYLIRVTKEGKIKGSLRAVRQTYDPKSGESIIQTGRITKSPKVSSIKKGDSLFLLEAPSIKDVKIFKSKGKSEIIKRIGGTEESGRIIQLSKETSKTSLLGRGARRVRIDPISKKQEPVFEFFNPKSSIMIRKSLPEKPISASLTKKISLIDRGTQTKFYATKGYSLGIPTLPTVKQVPLPKTPKVKIPKLDLSLSLPKPPKKVSSNLIDKQPTNLIKLKETTKVRQIDAPSLIEPPKLSSKVRIKSSPQKEISFFSSPSRIKLKKSTKKMVSSTLQPYSALKIRQELISSQLSYSGQKLKKIGIPKLSQPSISLFSTPVATIEPPPRIKIKKPKIGIPTGGLFGDISVGGGQSLMGRPKRYGGKTTYTASLGSVLLKQKKKKVSAKEFQKLSSNRFLGLELRPEVELS